MADTSIDLLEVLNNDNFVHSTFFRHFHYVTGTFLQCFQNVSEIFPFLANQNNMPTQNFDQLSSSVETFNTIPPNRVAREKFTVRSYNSFSLCLR